VTYNSPLNNNNLATLLPTLLDQATTYQGQFLPGRVNVLTSNQTVLLAVGFQDTDVQSILALRPQLQDLPTADSSFANPAWLMITAGLSKTTMQKLDPYITSKLVPNIFRVQAIGYFGQGPASARVEAVIDTNNGRPRIVYWRDISEMGKGFDLAQGH
jgi:hypothetical protein